MLDAIRRLALLLVALAFVASPLPGAEPSLLARTTDGVLVYVWQWVPIPGAPNGGRWVLVDVTA